MEFLNLAASIAYKFWKHKGYLCLLVVLICIFIGILVFLFKRYKETKIVKMICKKGQVFTNILGILGICIVALFLLVFVKEYNVFRNAFYSAYSTLSLSDIQDVIYYEQQENLYDEAGCENYFYDYNGEKIEAQNGSYMSNWIPCKAGDFLTRNGVATNVVCYFDINKNFIERVDSYGLATIQVPNNSDIAYVRMAVQPSSDRKIVYGTLISNSTINGNYYQIPALKVDERNFVSDFAVIKSPDGQEWKIRIDNDGNLSTVNVTGMISPSELPTDFPYYTIEGSGVGNEDYLIATFSDAYADKQFLFVMTPTGEIKWQTSVETGAINFRKIQYDDGTIRYAYQQFDKINGSAYIQNTNGGMLYTHVVLMDENFNVINDNIRPLEYGSIQDSNQRCESHDYKILSDSHYILTTVTFEEVDNIPGMEGTKVKVLNAIIQEQKDGKVIMQWESIDHPELYSASILNNEYSKFTSGEMYTDYVHLNAVAVDPKTYDLLISCRSIGLVKLDRKTGDILWIMGRGQNDIGGLSEEQIGLYQHDVRYVEDGSFTIFDNSGGVNSTSRVCRYWINDESLTLENYEEFTTPYKSTSMGSAKLIDDETDTYLISYGTGIGEFTFEERNFSTNTVNLQFAFADGSPIYRIFTGIEMTPTRDTD